MVGGKSWENWKHLNMIPYGRQEIDQSDIDSVTDALKSDFLTQGPVVPKFEESVASHLGCRHAVAVNSATAALHVACLALGLGEGDLLWTTPITFVASANCALYCGAQVDFVDIDPRTYNICVATLESKLIAAKRNGRLPKILVAVHLTGQSCEMADINKLAQTFGFKIIEDASHAIGGKYKGVNIGDCKYSDISVFSFHAVKIITTAEGGMAVTQSDQFAEKMSLLRSHGITRDAAKMTHESDGPWYYQQIELGFNYRMTELQAALGISQMKKLESFVKRRHEIAQRYNQLLKDLPIVLPWQHPDNYSSMHLYVIRLSLERGRLTRRRVFEAMREAGIGVNVHYIPVHTQPFYKKMGFKEGDYPNAEKFYQEAISLPIYPTLNEDQQDKVVEILAKELGI
jgi:UDP-4-amino-4,6-dideoxy-N-acetyl-beta-L-altrosamine transaminase